MAVIKMNKSIRIVRTLVQYVLIVVFFSASTDSTLAQAPRCVNYWPVIKYGTVNTRGGPWNQSGCYFDNISVNMGGFVANDILVALSFFELFADDKGSGSDFNYGTATVELSIHPYPNGFNVEFQTRTCFQDSNTDDANEYQIKYTIAAWIY